MSDCPSCSGSGLLEHWEVVPWDELEDWQIAETLVNGGEYRRRVVERCELCSS